MFYDPMIAKLITWAPTRDEAADLQVAALDRFEIDGPGHNIDFLCALMQHPRFRAGELTTGFIAEEYPEGFHGAPADEERLRVIAAIAAGMAFTRMGRARRTSGQLDGPPPVPCEWTVRIGGHDYEVTLGEGHAMVDQHRDRGHAATGCRGCAPPTASGNGADARPHGRAAGPRLADHHPRPPAPRPRPARPPRAARRADDREGAARPVAAAALPDAGAAGARCTWREGDKVEPGQPLATVEAMKMENILRAQRGGTVKAVQRPKSARAWRPTR